MSKNTAKLQFQQNIRATVINSEHKKLALSIADYISLVIFLLYLLVDFVPAFGSFSFGEPQWIYLNVLNIFVLIYLIWFEKLIFKPIFNQLIKNKISILYFCFIILSGFSILKTYNFDPAKRA